MIGRVQDEAPQASATYLGKVWADSWPNLAGLLGANLIFLAWCIPATLAWLLGLPALAVMLAPITVGPAAAGLFTYVGRLAREREARFWRDSSRGFRSSFVAGSLAAAVAILALSAHQMALRAVVESGRTPGSILLLAGQLGLLLILAIVGVHIFSLVGLYGQGVWEAFRNALALSLAHPIRTMAILGVAFTAFGIARGLRWGPLIILPALLALLAVNNTLLLVMRHRCSEGR